MASEEERAALYRQQCANRAAWRAEQATALAGNTPAAAAVTVAWAPLLPMSVDGWDCIPLEDIDPPPPSWLGRVPSDIELPEHLKSRKGV